MNNDSIIKEKTSPIFFRIAYLYIAIPFLIFVFGWFKLPVAIAAALIIISGLFLAMQDAPRTDVSQFNSANAVKIIVVIIIAIVWVYMSGIGGFAYQNYDHKWRNAVLKTLVEENWPVVISDASPHFQNPVALVYYFAFWLPAALFGKIYGLEAAHNFLFVWSVIGVLLVFYFIFAFNKKISIPVAIAFIFFSGLDIIGTKLLANSANFLWLTTTHIENWAYGFQMSSLTTQLFWVFNQAIPAWLLTLLLLHQKSNRSVVFIFSFSLMFSTLPAVGMIPLLLFILIRNLIKLYDKSIGFRRSIINMIADTFTIQNLLTGGLIGISSFLFLKINATGSGESEFINIKSLMMPYLLFVFFEFLVYYIAIFKKHSANGLYYLSLGTLLIVPFIKVGPHVDFVMRASIPSLIILFVLIINALYDYAKQRRYVLSAVLCVLLFLGAFTAQHEIMRAEVNTVNAAKEEEFKVTAEEIELIDNSLRNNFFGEYEDSIFFKYIAKEIEHNK